MADTRQKKLQVIAGNGPSSGRIVSTLVGCVAMAGSVLAQSAGPSSIGERGAKSQLNRGSAVTVAPSPNLQQANFKRTPNADEDKKLTPEEKIQLRRLLKSGQ